MPFSGIFSFCFPHRALAVSVTGPAAACDDGKGLRLTVSLMNSGNRTLKLLNEPHSVLADARTHNFDFRNAKTGARAKFKGDWVKHALDDLAKSKDPADFTVLAPGQYVTLKRDLAGLYDFSACGLGSYVVEPRLDFHALGKHGALFDIEADLAQTHTLDIKARTHSREKSQASLRSAAHAHAAAH